MTHPGSAKPSVPDAAGASSKNPLAFCSIAFRNEPIEALIRPLAELGYDAIEAFGGHVLGKPDGELETLRRSADRAGIALLAVSPYFVLTRGAEEFEQTLATARDSVRIARALGASKIRTFTDVSAAGLRSADAQPRHWDQAVDGLRQITAMAPELEFIVETHPRTLADTVQSTQRLLDRVGRANLKVNFQPNESFLAYGLNRAYDALAGRVTHMHLSQITERHGEGWVEAPGRIDFRAFLSHVTASGYGGSLSVEYCWEGATWERARSALAFLRPLLEPAHSPHPEPADRRRPA